MYKVDGYEFDYCLTDKKVYIYRHMYVYTSYGSLQQLVNMMKLVI